MNTTNPVVLVYSTQMLAPFWGGSEKYWYEIVMDPRLRERFQCAVVLADSPVTRERGRQLESLGVAADWYPFREPLPDITTRLKRRVERQFKGDVPEPRQTRWLNWMERYRPQLVWLNLATASHLYDLTEAVEACAHYHVPYWLVMQHSFEQLFFDSDDQIKAHAAILDGAARVVFVSDGNRRSVERALARPLTNAWRTNNAISHQFVTQAVAISKENPVRTTGTAQLLNLARFEPKWKGQHILLEALANPVWNDRDWRLTLQGGGPVQDYLRRLVAFYGFKQDRVTVADHNDDVLPLLSRTDLLVMPSLAEGMPFAMVEAMACGRPAVGTPVAGIEELITDNETGWLARSTEVADVSAAMERAWQQRARWPAVGATAQARIMADFDQEQTIPQVIRALEEDVVAHKA